MEYTILLYYKYHPVENPKQVVEEHKDFCKEHTILGRIIIAAEGINGTCAGTFQSIEEYKKYVWSLPGFEDMWFKETSLDHNPFSSCKIKYKRELVALNLAWLDPSKATKHVTPAEYHHLIGQDNVVVFDVRNKIEWQVGRFEGAVCPDIEFFRELPAELKKKKYQQYKNKKILLYCTGGIRCEKATHMFKEEGFKNVYQLEGGIYNYCSQYPHGKFEGTCFVFDERMQIVWDNNGKDATTITDDKVISCCFFCQEKSSRIVNDERKGHHLVVCCQDCDKAFDVSRIRYKKKISTV